VGQSRSKRRAWTRTDREREKRQRAIKKIEETVSEEAEEEREEVSGPASISATKSFHSERVRAERDREEDKCQLGNILRKRHDGLRGE
jgi:hypothetical protein